MPLNLEDDIGLAKESNFDSIFNRTLALEGGYSVDHAGPTNLGITQDTYNRYRGSKGLPVVPVLKITPPEAKEIAKIEYFDRPKISTLPDRVASVVFDHGFNAGPMKAIMTLQSTVGAKPDGVLGPKTKAAVNSFIQKNGEDDLLKKLLNTRENQYRNLANKNPKKYQQFLSGWLNRIQKIKDDLDLSMINPFAVNEASAEEATGGLGLEDDIGLFDVNDSAEYQKILYENTGKKSVINPGGKGISSERTVTIEVNGKWINLPTIINGKQLSFQEAINYAIESGKNNGVFNSRKEATDAAEQRSAYLDKMSGGQGEFHRSKKEWIPGIDSTPLNLEDDIGLFSQEKPVPEENPSLNLEDDIGLNEKPTGLAERIGKGFGMGGASMAKSFGGAMEWISKKVPQGVESSVWAGLINAAGKQVSKLGKSREEFYKIKDPDFVYNLSSGVASIGAFAAPGYGVMRTVQAARLAPKLAVAIGAGVSGVIESMTEAGGVYHQAKEKGMDEAGANAAANADFLLNLPITVLLNRIGIFGDKADEVLKGLKKIVANGKAIGMSSFSEGTQEALQQVASNVSVSDDPKSGVFESALIGVITGGGFKTIDVASDMFKPNEEGVIKAEAIPTQKDLEPIKLKIQTETGSKEVPIEQVEKPQAEETEKTEITSPLAPEIKVKQGFSTMPPAKETIDTEGIATPEIVQPGASQGPEIQKFAADNHDKILADYEQQNANIVSVDSMKKLFAPVGYTGQDSTPYQATAGKLAKEYFDKKLESDKGSGKNVILMTGGTGSGKSSIVAGYKNTDTLVFDLNLKNIAENERLVQQILDAGQNPVIKYVLRHPEQAYVDGMILRSLNKKSPDYGRIVSVGEHIEVHKQVRDTLMALMSKFGKKIKVQILDNRGKEGGIKQLPLAEFKKIAYNYNEIGKELENYVKTSNKIPDALRESYLRDTRRLNANAQEPTAKLAQGPDVQRGRGQNQSQVKTQVTPRPKESSPQGFPKPTDRPIDPLSTDEYDPHSMPMRLDKPSGEIKAISAPEVIDSLSEALKAFGSNAPIRLGRFRQKALGIFHPHVEVIRIKTANDIPTATHEVGHAIEKLLTPTIDVKIKSDDLIKTIPLTEVMPNYKFSDKAQGELLHLGKILYGARRPANGYVSEGIAEFTRLWVTDRVTAKKMAPDFYKFFSEDFLPQHPEGAKALDVANQAAIRWQEQGSVARAKQSIVNPESLKEKIINARNWAIQLKHSFIRTQVDMLEPLRIFRNQANNELGIPLPPEEDPFKTASTLRTTHDARTKYMVDTAMIDLAGNPVGAPLSDIQALVKNKRDDFTVYLWSKRARAAWEDPNKPEGRNPGLSLDDANQIIKELDSPEFQLAAQKVYDWNDGVLNYAAQSSPTFARIVESIRNSDPGYYIPLSREFRELDNIWGRGAVRASAKGGKLSGRFKGSGRRIKDPFPQMIANARNIVKAAHNRVVLDQMIKLSKVPGMGNLIEIVPKDMVPATQATLMDIIKKIKGDLNSAGIKLELPEKMTQEQLDSLIGETVTFFTPAQSPHGKDPIIPMWNKDKVEWYQVDSELYKALESMEVYRLPDIAGFPIVDWLLGKPTRIFRAGTTGLRASFGLITNPIRDIQTLYVNTLSNKNSFALFKEWVRAFSNAGFRHVPGVGNIDPYLETFIRLGGEMAQPLGQDIPYTRRAARQLFQGNLIKYIDPRNMFDSIRDILQFPESAPRVAELKLLAEKIGWKPGEPMTFGQSLELLSAAKQVTTDFTSVGEFGRVMNQLIPFYNAAIQGPRANWRAVKDHPQRFILRGLVLTAATLALWWKYKDQEWYKQMNPREKFLYWHFPVTIRGEKTLLRLPRAFEVGQIFASMPEALIDASYRQDPDIVRDWRGTFIETMLPDWKPVLLKESLAQASNQDSFSQRPIVSQSLDNKPPEEQYDEYSSKVSIFLGNLFKASPKRIDHAINGVGGPVTGDILGILGLGGEGIQKEKEAADIPLAGRLFQRGGELGSQPKAIGMMYDLLEKAKGHQYSEKNPETPKERQLRLMLTDAARAVSNLYLVRRHTPEILLREKITKQALSIATESVRRYNLQQIGRSQFQSERRQTERMRKRFR